MFNPEREEKEVWGLESTSINPTNCKKTCSKIHCLTMIWFGLIIQPDIYTSLSHNYKVNDKNSIICMIYMVMNFHTIQTMITVWTQCNTLHTYIYIEMKCTPWLQIIIILQI